jgi:hypothetical protein
MGRKKLTIGEEKILAVVQDQYGEQNSQKDVIYSDEGNAMIFAKDEHGVPYKLIDLTAVAAMCENGTIKSERELLSKWICTPND